MSRTRLHMDPAFRDALARGGLGARDLARAEIGDLVQRRPLREVRRVELGAGGPALYVKRIRIEGARAQLQALWRGDPATREAGALSLARVAGVRAARAVAFGRAGLRGCLLATEEIRGRDLAGALAFAGARERRRLLREAGVLLARLHAAGILDEVRCKDVIVAEDGALALIDRDPRNASTALAHAPDGALRCLARCEYLRLRGGARLGERERLRVLAAYCAASPARLALRDALPVVQAALAQELARHRASPALVAEFGHLDA
jgi:hypothetical protein